MSRIRPIAPPYAPGVEEALNRASPAWRESEPLEIFRIWARHPKLGRAISPVGEFLLRGGDVEDRDRELLILRTCALTGAEYEWGVHAVGYARKAKLEAGTIEATATRPTTDAEWSGRERLLLRIVDEFEATVDISDELWRELQEQWTSPQILELLLIAGFYRFVALSVRATRAALEDWAPRFPPDHLSSR